MESKTMTNTVALKDYIIDVTGTAVKPTATYEVILENNTDFILKRRTAKTDRELVILVSQGLSYIKDCKAGTIEPVSEAGLQAYLRDLKDGCIELQKVYWLPTLCRDSISLIMDVISDEVLTDMCRHNVLDIQDPLRFVSYWKQNSKLFVRLHNLFPKKAEYAKYRNSLPAIFWLEREYGTNEAIYFAEKLVQSGISSIDFSRGGYYGYQNYENTGGSIKEIALFQEILLSSFHINLRRFIDYLFFDLYAQGYSNINSTFFNEYMDYLNMQRDFYGKVKEKYPAYFKTAHDVMALKVNQAKLIAKCKDFSVQAEEIKDLAYEGMGYCIVIPTKPEELAEEGINLSHCVGQYIDRVAEGVCKILFLRRRNTPDESLVTLQLSGNQICQAQGANRRSITDKERTFLKHWGREKEIGIAV